MRKHQSNTLLPPLHSPLFFLCVCFSQAVSVAWCWRLRGVCVLWEVPESAERSKVAVTHRGILVRKADWRSLAGGYKAHLLLCARVRSLWQHLGDLKPQVGAGVMVTAVRPSQEWAWHAVLLVSGLASLSCASDGEYIYVF